MSSLVDEETTFSNQDIGKQVLTHLKTYCFFVYFQRSHIGAQNHMMNLEKMSFKLRDDKQKNQYTDKYGDSNKNVQLAFYDLENEIELSSSLHDLKTTSQENKTKLIFFSSEALMVGFYVKARALKIGIDSIPICIYTSSIHCDFSKFMGWGEPSIDNLSGLSVNQLEGDVRKWVQSPTEKVDIWAAQIKVSPQGGSIQKLNQQNGDLDKFKSSQHRQLFCSNLSIGYHPQLLLDYEKRKTKQRSIFNKFIYSIQGMKKFCCVGNSDMREATGVVKIDFTDEKGEHQIMKYLRDIEGEEDEQYLNSKKQAKNKKNVLSVVFSNINRFFGEKIKDNNVSKMNDQKLQLITFQSISQSTKVASVSGKINMQFSPDHPVFLHVNDSCFRLQKPLSIKLQSYGKLRMIINKETLNC